MQNALWKGEPIIACRVAQNTNMDVAVRVASKEKELRCPDPDCGNPLLCYRHGEIRIPHFAHVGNNVVCDYAKFDSQNNEMQKEVCRHVYEILSAQGYKVKMEVKIFGHQYTHLTIEYESTILAIQIVPYNISAKKVSNWTRACKQYGIMPLVLFIGAETFSKGIYVKSTYAFLYNRHVNNSTVCKNIFLISDDASKMTLYKRDKHMSEYVYKGQYIESMDRDSVFWESATLEDMTFEDGEWSIKGYNGRYNEWLIKRMDTFKQEVSLIEKRERMWEEQRRAVAKHCAEEQRRIEEFELGCSDIIRLVRERVFTYLSSRGFRVEKDKKALPYHYSHLLFDYDGKKHAIEVIDETISKRRIDALVNWYMQNQIQVHWIVAGNSDFIEDEKPYFAHENLLTKTDILIVGVTGDVVLQQINDPNSYKIHGVEVKSQNYPEWFVKKARVDELIWENNRFTIPHFYEDYQVWLEKKQRKFKEKLDAEEKKAEEQRRCEIEQIIRMEEDFRIQRAKEDIQILEKQTITPGQQDSGQRWMEVTRGVGTNSACVNSRPSIPNVFPQAKITEEDRKWRDSHKGITEEQKQKVRELLAKHKKDENHS